MSTIAGQLNWPFAAAWTAICGLVWLLAAVWPPAELTSLPWLIVAALFAQLMTLALRRRWILRWTNSNRSEVEPGDGTEPPTFGLALLEQHDRETTWVLCWVSQIYWIGVLLLGPSLLGALALAGTCAIIEFILLPYGPPAWYHSLAGWISKSNLARPGESTDSREFRLVSNTNETSEEADADESQNLGASFHAQGEGDAQYLHGWRRYQMEPGQKNLTLTIGFFPPFLTPPACELDHEGDEDISYDIEHITPVGVRILIKRRQAAASASGKLLWHAS